MHGARIRCRYLKGTQSADGRIFDHEHAAGKENRLFYIMRNKQYGLAVALPLIEQPFLHGDAREKVER